MKRAVFVCVVLSAATAAAGSRPPAVAGAFYPGDAQELRTRVETMLAEAGGSEIEGVARALVVPHAGYVFSGPTAAKAFATLPEKGIERVILLGPSHHAGFGGGALPAEGVTSFATPMGEIPLDLEVLAKLRKQTVFSGPAHAHDREHSLEVELPFLQVVAPRAKLVPIVIGVNTDAAKGLAIARALAPYLDGSTVVIASSDFTHHGRRYGWSPYDGPDLGETLLEVGRQTVDRVASIDPRGFRLQIEVSGDTVCGARPLAVLTEILDHAFTGAGRVLEVTTSGHLTDDFDLSVTYASVVFEGSWKPWSDEAPASEVELGPGDGQELTRLARATIRSWLSHDVSLAGWFAEHPDRDKLLMPAGAFVTLNNTGRRARREGKLRACMGVIEAKQPLVDAVIQAAVWAAQDPRFPALELGELDELEVEISVLSPARRVKSFKLIEVGKHGVVMSKNGRRAVFLPQVAPEQGWDRETMLEHLSVKAGLPKDAWQHGAAFEVFTARVFSEHS